MYKQYTQQELCNQVYCAVVGASEPMTRLEICRAINRAKSPHILAMIESLRDSGWLIEQQGTGRNGKPTLYYVPGHKIEIEQPA